MPTGVFSHAGRRVLPYRHARWRVLPQRQASWHYSLGRLRTAKEDFRKHSVHFSIVTTKMPYCEHDCVLLIAHKH